MGWGIFQTTTTLFNRAPINLSVRFDGQEKTIVSGMNPGFPTLAVRYAKKQNPRMGTEQFYNPSMTGFESLIVDLGDKKDKTPREPLTEQEWQEHLDAPMRLNRAEMEDEKGVKTVLRGKKVKNAFEARTGVNAGFDELSGHE